MARQPLNRVEAQAKRVQRAEQSLAKVEARGGRAGEVAAAVTTIVEEVGRRVREHCTVLHTGGQTGEGPAPWDRLLGEQAAPGDEREAGVLTGHMVLLHL